MYEGYVYVANKVFPTLLAISEAEQERGLMNIDWPPPVMTFVYSSPKVNKFWMKNTPSKLDIVFCYHNKISQIHNGEPFSTSIIGKDQLSDLVIEFPYGIIKDLGIKIGNKVGVVKPTLNELKAILSSKK